MTNIKPIRDIEKLSPLFRKKVKAFLREMKKIDPMAPHETLRTAERQLYLYRTGKSKVKHSNHQDGVAVDLHFTTGEAFPRAGSSRWKTSAKIAKKYGIDCGGILWDWDWNHFQDDGSKEQLIIKGVPEWGQVFAQKMKTKGITTDPKLEIMINGGETIPLYQFMGVIEKYVE